VAHEAGLSEGKLDELINFESSDSYCDREKAALPTPRPSRGRIDRTTGSGSPAFALQRRGIVELACFIALTMGQQSWTPDAQPSITIK